MQDTVNVAKDFLGLYFRIDRRDIDDARVQRMVEKAAIDDFGEIRRGCSTGN